MVYTGRPFTDIEIKTQGRHDTDLKKGMKLVSSRRIFKLFRIVEMPCIRGLLATTSRQILRLKLHKRQSLNATPFGSLNQRFSRFHAFNFVALIFSLFPEVEVKARLCDIQSLSWNRTHHWLGALEFVSSRNAAAIQVIYFQVIHAVRPSFWNEAILGS